MAPPRVAARCTARATNTRALRSSSSQAVKCRRGTGLGASRRACPRSSGLCSLGSATHRARAVLRDGSAGPWKSPGASARKTPAGLKKSASDGSIFSPADTFLALRASAVEAATTWGASVLEAWSVGEAAKTSDSEAPESGEDKLEAPRRAKTMKRSASAGGRRPPPSSRTLEHEAPAVEAAGAGGGGGGDEDRAARGDASSKGIYSMFQRTVAALQPAQVDITSFLRLTAAPELKYVRKMASLSSLTYALDRLTPRNLQKAHRMVFVTSSRCCEVPTVAGASAEAAILDGDGGAAALVDLLSEATLDSVTKGFTLAPWSATKPASSLDGKVGDALAKAHETAEGLESDAGMRTLDVEDELHPVPQTDVKSTGFSTGDCPSEWFIADDPATSTRAFVIQGSDSMESWKTNLTFDPVMFEDPSLGTTIHRGVYLAALSLYEKFLPLVEEHLGSSPFARVSFTGHSLGGSLAICLALMYKHRGVLRAEQLGPVYTFGAAAVFHESPQPTSAELAPRRGSASTSRGTPSNSMTMRMRAVNGSLLHRVGLRTTAVHNVVMHRDIVPRAFACDYSPVVPVLASGVLGASFVDHIGSMDGEDRRPMYCHLGVMSMLQPPEDAHFMRPGEGFHPLLPRTPGLFRLVEPGLVARAVARATASKAGEEGGEDAGSTPTLSVPSTLHEVEMLLLDNPHPLETLSDLRAFGDDGTISRFHNPDHYTKGLTACLHAEDKRSRVRAAITRVLPYMNKSDGKAPRVTQAILGPLATLDDLEGATMEEIEALEAAEDAVKDCVEAVEEDIVNVDASA